MRKVVLLVGVTLLLAPGLAWAWELDEKPVAPGEWGFRPVDGATSAMNPPAFVWRPQKGATRYDLQIAPDPSFQKIEYEITGLDLYCHCPPRSLAPGTWYWRFRAHHNKRGPSAWSMVRTFTLTSEATALPMPPRAELLARIPTQHPRLFVRPEDVPRLRELARTRLAPIYRALVRRCDAILKDPPPTDEPRKYPPGTTFKSEEWRELWWGNRVYTVRVLDSAAALGFTWLLDGNERYGQEARRLLMECAKWDPKGATGFIYNDEAGMPYAYLFARTYTFIHPLLSEEERRICREVMRVRGAEMYGRLHPQHIWAPYNSHANRAWHKMGEVGIAFLGEIPEAEDWVWYAMNVFYCAYPVWCDEDGGWHEGVAYWRSYMSRFTWWADVMKAAMGIDAYIKPYFSQVGYYPMYLQPPGTRGGGFGDLANTLDSSGNLGLMQIFAAQSGNPYWQWYVEAHGRPAPRADYIEFVRGATPAVKAEPPTPLPTSRCFRGVGQAYLNTTLLNAKDNVQVLFKSSPFGTQSHGYDANNAFMLYVGGEPLLLSSGHRDIYGSAHHKQWMWSTRSVNSITVNGKGQVEHSAESTGRIVDFVTTPAFDLVSGEAGAAYGRELRRFTRTILFAKPDVVVIHDRLVAREPSHFEYWLHAPTEMKLEGQRATVVKNEVACDIALLEPRGLEITQTDQFDPPPRERVKLRQFHLTARTPGKAADMTFITVLRPRRTAEPAITGEELTQESGAWRLVARTADGKLECTLPVDDDGSYVLRRLDADGTVVAEFTRAATPREN